MHVLIINLPQSTDRFQQQQTQCERLALAYSRLAAVSITDFDETTYQQSAFSWQRPLKKTELACFLSHQKAWQTVLARGEPCLILEDDAVLACDIATLLHALTPLKNIDFINLETHGRKKILAKSPSHALLNSKYQLFANLLDRSGAAGYVLFPSGAQKLLAHAKTHPIALADAFIHNCEALSAYQIEPAVVIQSDQCAAHGITPPQIHDSMIAKLQPQMPKPQSAFATLRFKIRRIHAQLKLGVRQLRGFIIGTKRLVRVNPEDFHH